MSYVHVITDEMIEASNKKHEKELEEFFKKLAEAPLYIGLDDGNKIEWHPFEPTNDEKRS